MDIHKILDRQKATVSNLLKNYDGKLPLHLYLKKYFSENRKHGSRDRKAITELCYAYFRLGENVNRLQLGSTPLSIPQVLTLAGFISGALSRPDDLLPGALKDAPGEAPIDRFNQLRQHYTVLGTEALFPFKAKVSEDVDLQALREALLKKPDLFIRIRPGGGERVLNTLQTQQVSYQLAGHDTISLLPGTPVNQLLEVNKDVVIQDISSQRMATFLEMLLQDRHINDPAGAHKKIKTWDCCAASGGKSLLAWDVFKKAGQPVSLTVSDIRPSIVTNLDKRFKEAGITGYRKKILDLLSPEPLPFINLFDLVLCDAPCTGSGTWGRSPENILYFDEAAIAAFHKKQTGIAAKACKAVAPGGYFLYMTCSVFEQENEAVVDFISSNSGMKLVASRLITGYTQNGDTMFGALFTRRK